MKGFGWYALAVAAIILAIGSAAAAFTGVAGRQAIVASGILALVIQLVSFVVARTFQPDRVMLGWGLGSVMRVVMLVLYAVFVGRIWRAPIAPALLSFAGFLFATMVVEPLFLRR